MDIVENIVRLRSELPEGVELVAVSKTYPAASIMAAYDAGQRVFGESRPQEMKEKYGVLPKDIRWHMIGHLQTNKVKYIAPFVELIHSVDSEHLIEIINAQAAKCGRVIDILLEVKIAREETKHGWEEQDLAAYLESGSYRNRSNIRIRGLMGIATYTEDTGTVRSEFTRLRELRDRYAEKYFGSRFDILSMGMTSDFRTAVECGANMVRIGSMIFGSREGM